MKIAGRETGREELGEWRDGAGRLGERLDWK
jgi:hypothetical protein